jgi:diadenosine tetraphosphate (Ap4A) HIT family hydrolase
LIVESRRHVLDLAGMSLEEVVALMALLPRLFKALREGFGAERVYLLSTEAFAPHFHAWLYPWQSADVQRGIAFLVQERACTADEAGSAAGIVSRLLSARTS